MKNSSTGHLGRLFNAVILRVAACNARGSQPYEKTTRFPITTFGNDARRGQLRGFTLIELLVVVLIVGILSAIALPQYNKAVLKSRVATAFARLSALDQSQTVFHMANGTYATDMDALGVGLKEVECHPSLDSLVYCVGFVGVAGTLFFEWHGYHATAQKYWICAARIGNEAAQGICQSYAKEWGGTRAPYDSGKYVYYFGAPR